MGKYLLIKIRLHSVWRESSNWRVVFAVRYFVNSFDWNNLEIGISLGGFWLSESTHLISFTNVKVDTQPINYNAHNHCVIWKIDNLPVRLTSIINLLWQQTVQLLSFNQFCIFTRKCCKFDVCYSIYLLVYGFQVDWLTGVLCLFQHY